MSTALPINPISVSQGQGFIANVERVLRVDLSIADVTGLNTAKIIMPALTGYIYEVRSAMIIRQARYDTQPGALRIRCVTSAPFAWIDFGSTILTTAGANGISASWSRSVLGAAGSDDSATSAGSKAVDIFVNTGNPTVSVANPGSPLTVLVTYMIIPTYVANVGSY